MLNISLTWLNHANKTFFSPRHFNAKTGWIGIFASRHRNITFPPLEKTGSSSCRVALLFETREIRRIHVPSVQLLKNRLEARMKHGFQEFIPRCRLKGGSGTDQRESKPALLPGAIPTSGRLSQIHGFPPHSRETRKSFATFRSPDRRAGRVTKRLTNSASRPTRAQR